MLIFVLCFVCLLIFPYYINLTIVLCDFFLPANYPSYAIFSILLLLLASLHLYINPPPWPHANTYLTFIHAFVYAAILGSISPLHTYTHYYLFSISVVMRHVHNLCELSVLHPTLPFLLLQFWVSPAYDTIKHKEKTNGNL